MAEVRQIPSAVGAFEAQVFDMGKTYRTIMTQEASRRKAQSDQKKELDKMMANTYAAKGKGRLQDMPELEKQYKELQDYYVNNGSAIMKGGQEFLEFQKKRSEFIFEAEQANLRKQRDQQLSPFFKLKLDKEGLSDKSNELMTIFNLPYNDPRRKNYQYEGSDGQMHGIDELNVTDIEKYTRFNEVEFMKKINTVAPKKVVKDLRIEPSQEYNLPKGYQIAVTGEYEIRDPVKIVQAVTGELISTPDARNTYAKMFNNETPESLVKASEEMKIFNQVFKSAGYAQIINSETDNQPGITNPEEFAIYRNLKANLPQNLGEKISTQLVTAKLGMERANLAQRKWANFLDLQSRNIPIDEAANRFIDTNPTDKQLEDFAKSETKLLAATYAGGGGTMPGKVTYFKPGTFNPTKDSPGLTNVGAPSFIGNKGVLVYTTQERLMKTEDNKEVPITDIDEARRLYGSAYEYRVDPKTNNVFAAESTVVPVGGITSAERGRLLKYGYLRASQAQKGQEAFDMLYKGLYQTGTGAIPEPGTNIQVGKGKGERFRTGQTFIEKK
jgi:hypothetical protein